MCAALTNRRRSKTLQPAAGCCRLGLTCAPSPHVTVPFTLRKPFSKFPRTWRLPLHPSPPPPLPPRPLALHALIPSHFSSPASLPGPVPARPGGTAAATAADPSHRHESYDSRSGPQDLRLASRADLPFSVLQCLAAGHHGMPLVSSPSSRPGCSSLLRPRPACRASFLYPTGRDCKAPAEPLLPHIAQLAGPLLPCVMTWRA